MRYAVVYVAALATMVVLDFTWLGLIAAPLYRDALGPLMADPVNLPAAVVFYLVYALGLVVFAVRPADSGGVARALGRGALFGFFAYATYDLTNLATLKGYPLSIALVDMAWGTVISAAAATVARGTLRRQ